MFPTDLKKYKIADFNKMKGVVFHRAVNRHREPNWDEACPEVTPIEDYLNMEEMTDRLVDRTIEVADVYIYGPRENEGIPSSTESSDTVIYDFESTCRFYDKERNVCQRNICECRDQVLAFDEKTSKDAGECEQYTYVGKSASAIFKEVEDIESKKRKVKMVENISGLDCKINSSEDSTLTVSMAVDSNSPDCICVTEVPICLSEEETNIENPKDTSKESLIGVILDWPTIEEFSLKDTMQRIELYCHLWEKDPKWKFSIDHIKDKTDCSGSVVHIVEVCFCIPTESYPVAQVTVSVFFHIEVAQLIPPSMKIKVTYTFETQRYSYVPSDDVSSQVVQLTRIHNHKLNLYKRLTY